VTAEEGTFVVGFTNHGVPGLGIEISREWLESKTV